MQKIFSIDFSSIPITMSINTVLNKDISVNEVSYIHIDPEKFFSSLAKNEISSDEFCNYKKKYDDETNDLKEAYNKIISLEINSDILEDTMDNLKNKINNIIEINDDTVLNIASSLFEKIIVETDRSDNDRSKAILHCQLKIRGSEEDKRAFFLPKINSLIGSNSRFLWARGNYLYL